MIWHELIKKYLREVGGLGTILYDLQYSNKLAVVALGGNALIIDKNRKTIPDQFNAIKETVKHITDMIAEGWQVVITHGNGPQVGFMLRRSELSLRELHPVPLGYCGADTQGAIGYMIQKALRNEFKERSINKKSCHCHYPGGSRLRKSCFRKPIQTHRVFYR